jgi:hypothetical protein
MTDENPEPSIRLIPRSGSRPDLRDYANQRDVDELAVLSEKLSTVEYQLNCLAGSRDVSDRRWRINLRRRRRELIREHNQRLRDFEAAMMAAWQEAGYDLTAYRWRMRYTSGWDGRYVETTFDTVAPRDEILADHRWDNNTVHELTCLGPAEAG